MNFSNIKLYSGCDILIHKNNVHQKGFDKTIAFEEMLNIAYEHNCPILVKNGKGKWYLKGHGTSIEQLQKQIEGQVEVLDRLEKNKYKNVKLWLLER